MERDRDGSIEITWDPDKAIENRRPQVSVSHRLLVACFTERGHAVRIISARRATRREREDYEAR